MFTKDYFEDFINRRLGEYFKVFPTGVATVTLKVMPDHEFHLQRILECTDELLTFAYYDGKKQVKLPKGERERIHETGFPVITIPLREIRWVEFNPGKPGGAKQEAGFRYGKT